MRHPKRLELYGKNNKILSSKERGWAITNAQNSSFETTVNSISNVVN